MENITQSGIFSRKSLYNQQQPHHVARHQTGHVFDQVIVVIDPEYLGLEQWQCQVVGEGFFQNLPRNQYDILRIWETFSSKEPPSIKEFPGEPYRVKKPIPVKIHLLDETTFGASFEQGNIGWSDESEDEAIEGLKVEILNALEDFEAHESILGPEPKRQLAVLRNHLEHVRQA